MTSVSTLFDHTHIDNHSPHTLFLLHGTGGDKTDFLFFDDLLEKKYNIVSLQGNVSENGMPRFFRRTAPGVFDQDNIRRETLKLEEFIDSWCLKMKTTPQDLCFLGYSNGANMILATLFYYPHLIQTGALLHPMVPFAPDDSVDLSKSNIFISIGTDDPMVPLDQGRAVSSTIVRRGGQVTTKEYEGGHQISEDEIRDVTEFWNLAFVGS